MSPTGCWNLMATTKVIILLFSLQWNLSTAAVIQPRVPQPQHDHPTDRPSSFISSDLLKKLNGDMSETSIVANIPKMNIVSVQQLYPKLRQNTKRIVAKFGPYDLVGRGVKAIANYVVFKANRSSNPNHLLSSAPWTQRVKPSSTLQAAVYATTAPFSP